MEWHDITDLPFATGLTPHSGGLSPDSDYDTVHFDRVTFADERAASSRFIDCAFTGVTVQGGRLQRDRFSDVFLRDVRLVATSLAETSWTGVTAARSMAAGVEAFGARLRRVTFRGCKLDSVNFREAQLTDVTFDSCDLRHVDFAGATLTRTAFPGSRLERTDFSRAQLAGTDLRGAELGIIISPDSLRGAIVSAGQLVFLAPLLAETLGITVSDD